LLLPLLQLNLDFDDDDENRVLLLLLLHHTNLM
jgi:hypothetical protein